MCACVLTWSHTHTNTHENQNMLSTVVKISTFKINFYPLFYRVGEYICNSNIPKGTCNQNILRTLTNQL